MVKILVILLSELKFSNIDGKVLETYPATTAAVANPTKKLEAREAGLLICHNSFKSIYRSFHIFNCRQLYFTYKLYFAYILHGTIYSIFAYYMRTVQ